jgi:protocatechuate 3,4-dioxygenase beta subunit
MAPILALIVLAQDRPTPEWLPLLEAPPNLTNVLTIPPPTHAGPPMEIRGRVLKADRKTPVAGVIVYFHHTDGEGHYTRPPGARPTEWVYWHGSNRGWLKTDSGGNYVLKSTRPAPYPNRRVPAHIHVYGLPPGSREGVTFPGIVFEGDPLLSPRDTGRVTLTKDKNGVLQGRFDLILPKSQTRP